MAEQRKWAKGRSWWQTAEKPQGGFVLVREKALLAAWAALSNDEIGLRDFRVWLASFEAVERRLSARSRRSPRFSHKELHKLVGGVGGQHIRSSVRKLQRAGLGIWSDGKIELLGGRSSTLKSEGRLVPVPRQLLRHLASGKGRAYIATALGHLLRCLYYRGGICVSGGYCKSTWIADTFSVSVRSAKEARCELTRLGFLQLLDADQTRLNRFGCPVVVALDRLSTTEIAPRPVVSATKSAPPGKHKNLSLRRSEHQKPGSAQYASGVFYGSVREPSPRLSDVKLSDLAVPTRLVSLFIDAERHGLVRRCEAEKLAFFATAAHARRVATRNVGGLFASLVRKRCHRFITQLDEDTARQNIASLRNGDCQIPVRIGKVGAASIEVEGESPQLWAKTIRRRRRGHRVRSGG